MNFTNSIHVVALEDDPLYLSLFRRCIEGVEGLVWLGGFCEVDTFLVEVCKLDADLFFLDIHIKNQLGFDCIKPLKELYPRSKIIMLSAHDDDEYVLQSFVKGADGYLLKDATPEVIRAGIDDALAGGAPMSASIARKVIRALKKLESDSDGTFNKSETTSSFNEEKPNIPDLPLSKREIEILEMLATGKKYTRIAKELHIALSTVKTHVRHIYEKLHVSNKAQAVMYWARQTGS